MSGGWAGCVLRVKSTPVVRDGEHQSVFFDSSCDCNPCGAAVFYRIGDEFAYDAQNRVCGVVRQLRARHVESDRKSDVVQNRAQSLPYCAFHVGLVQRAGAQVPKAVSQLFARRLEDGGRQEQIGSGLFGIAALVSKSRIDLKRNSGKVLRNGIVQLDGESGAFVDAER